MNAVLEQIKSRRSIRKYGPDPIPQEILDQIIEAGTYAASGKGHCATENQADDRRKKFFQISSSLFSIFSILSHSERA